MKKSNIKYQNDTSRLKNNPPAGGYDNFPFCFLHFDFREGFGLIEIIVVAAIASTTLAAFLQAGILSVRLLHAERESLEATMLAQEGMEAVRSVRDESWTNNIVPLVNGTVYYPSVVNSKWTLGTTAPGLINQVYTRQIIFSQVSRNGTDDIATSGTVDAGTRKVTVTVAWSTKQVQLVAYITDFQSKLSPTVESKAISYEGAITDTDMISFPSNNAGDGDPAQSFTTLASAIKVTRADAYLRRTTAAPSDIYAEIRTSPTGTVLGISNLITGSTIATSTPAWVEFRFVPEVPLSAATIYYLRLRSIPSSATAGSESKNGVNWIYLQSAGSGPYSGGYARQYIEHLGNPADAGTQLDQYDFGFKIYAL